MVTALRLDCGVALTCLDKHLIRLSLGGRRVFTSSTVYVAC